VMSNSSASYQQTFEIVPKIWSEKNWFAVYTCVNQEKLVADRLDQRGIEHYLPLYNTVRRRSDRRVQLSLPLFPGYLFVRIPLLERLRVLEIPRVVRLVGFDATPLAVPDGEIELLQKGLSSAVTTQPCEYLKKGCSVRVLNGPFAGAEGILLKRKQDFRVVISISTIMRSFTVEVGEEDVERIATSKMKFLN
jgi:transcriptional antiterminator NusG